MKCNNFFDCEDRYKILSVNKLVRQGLYEKFSECNPSIIRFLQVNIKIETRLAEQIGRAAQQC